MSRDLTRRQAPEERELENKRAQLATLEVELAQHELDLATLKAELEIFDARYMREVGILYASQRCRADPPAKTTRSAGAVSRQHYGWMVPIVGFAGCGLGYPFNSRIDADNARTPIMAQAKESQRCTWCGNSESELTKDPVFSRGLGGTLQLAIPSCGACKEKIDKAEIETEVIHRSPFAGKYPTGKHAAAGKR